MNSSSAGLTHQACRDAKALAGPWERGTSPMRAPGGCVHMRRVTIGWLRASRRGLDPSHELRTPHTRFDTIERVRTVVRANRS
jgi:hypothetical protein